MSVPTRREAVSLLLSLGPPVWHVRHARAVADVAAWLAMRARLAGRPVDRRLVETAALLHDVDKLPAVHAAVAGLPHGKGSAEWLTRRGFEPLAAPVAVHPVTRLADARWFDRWLEAASDAELIVAYADKRAGQRLEPMRSRFASWSERYPTREAGGGDGAWPQATVEAIWTRALSLEARVCELADVRPADVRRLAWTAAAFHAGVPA